jgi:hypothetical protein
MKKVAYFCLVMGGLFLVIQNTFYGYMDETGVVHDSLFLPLGSLLVMFGLFFYIVSLFYKK